MSLNNNPTLRQTQLKCGRMLKLQHVQCGQMGLHQERMPRSVHQLGRIALQNVRRTRLRLPRTLRLHVGQSHFTTCSSRQVPDLHSGIYLNLYKKIKL